MTSIWSVKYLPNPSLEKSGFCFLSLTIVIFIVISLRFRAELYFFFVCGLPAGPASSRGCVAACDARCALVCGTPRGDGRVSDLPPRCAHANVIEFPPRSAPDGISHVSCFILRPDGHFAPLRSPAENHRNTFCVFVLFRAALFTTRIVFSQNPGRVRAIF